MPKKEPLEHLGRHPGYQGDKKMPSLIIPDFSGGEVGPSVYGRVDTNEYRKSLRTARNVFVHPSGGVSNRPGTIFCGPVKDHANPPRLIEFQFKTEDTYVIELGAGYFRFIRNGYHIVETVKDITAVTAADPAVVTSAAHGYANGDEVFIAALDGPTELNGGRYLVANVATDTFELTSQVTSDNIDSTNLTAYVSGGKVARIYEIANTYTQTDLDQISFVQSGDVITLVHRDFDPGNLSRTAHTSWTFTAISFAPDIAEPATVTVTPTGTTGSTSYSYKVSAIQDETFVEGNTTTGTTATGNATLDETNFNALSWTAVTGAFRYNIYKLQNGLYGFLGSSETTAYNDQGDFAPNLDTGPRELINPFSGANNAPGAVGFYQQRKVYGNTNNNPDSVWYSVTGDYNNFSRAFPSAADDSFQAVLNQRQINEIRHLIALDGLLVFTAGAEWEISSGSDVGFSIESFKQKPQSNWGSSWIQPLLVGGTVLFVQNLSSTVRSFGFTFEKNGYSGNNMGILANHLFLGRKIIDWTYAAIPHTIVWACTDDGTLLSLTFNQEQNVIAWTRNDTKGLFYSTATIPNIDAGEDVSYFVVKRHIDGEDVAYIERLHTRKFPDIRDNFFVDSGLTLDGPHSITAVSVDSDGTVTVTVTDNPFMDDEEIEISEVIWVPDVDDFGEETQPYPNLNNRRFIVAGTVGNTFTLNELDGTEFDGSDLPGYVAGGYARCAVDKIYGLHHLAGETVTMMGDGDVVGHDLVVGSDGSITLPHKMARIHVGLRYLSDIELLDIEGPTTTIQGIKKRIPSATLRLENSRGFWIGPDKDTLTESKWRTDGFMGDPIQPLTGDYHINFSGKWNTNGRVFIRQADPLPLTLTAVIPDIAVSPPQITK